MRRGRYWCACFSLTLIGAVSAQNLPDGEGRSTVAKVCGGCHEVSIVASQKMSRPEWADLVDQMMDKGAKATEKEVQTILDYLSTHFGKK
jgi:hypothetical protein